MVANRAVSRRQRKAGAFLILLGLLGTLFGIATPFAQADPIGSGSSVGNFEIDGNFADDADPAIDWGGVADLANRLTFDDDLQTPDPNGPGDQGYVGGAKEEDRSTWGCAADSGDDPLKDDIKYILAYPSLSIDNASVAFSYVRNKAQGNTNVVIELNQNPINTCSPVNDRTPGDLVLYFNFPGGSDQADLEASVWSGSALVPFDVPAGVANAITNPAEVDVPSSISAIVAAKGLPTSVDARDMGEAAIDLFKLEKALRGSGVNVGPVLSCPGLGAANIRTRSSGESGSSQLHDNFPSLGIDLSNCGSLKIKKVDDLGQPMAGIQFGLFGSQAAALAGTPLATLPTTPAQDLVCTTDAAGICTFPKVPAGDYWINELNLGAGYTADSDLPQKVTIAAFADVDLTATPFVNTLRTGSVKVTKAVVDGNGDVLQLSDLSYLNGIRFELRSNGAVVKRRDGSNATCTLALTSASTDPSCTITQVPFGTYSVVEDATTVPAGLDVGQSPTVTVNSDSPAVASVTYRDPADPLNVSIDKVGPDTANVGDTITYTFTVGLGNLPFDTTDDVDLQPLTSVAVTEVVSAPDFADRCTASALTLTNKENVGPLGANWLENGERWAYSCTHVVTMADATDNDGAVLKNRARVQGTDRYGRTASDTDDHVVTILLPDLHIVKSPDDGRVFPGQTATYTIVVSNAGPGRANAVTLSDPLPDGIDWSATITSPDGDDTCSIAPNVGTDDQVLSCSFGNLASGGSKTVTVSGSTDSGDCGPLPNTATADAGNDDPVSDGARITVDCADVTVAKVAVADPINATDNAAFGITVTNLSSTVPAQGVVLTDSLPDGIDWAVGGANADSCSIAPDTGTSGQVLTCNFGSIAAAGTRTVTVSGTTDPADCGVLTNTAVVAASNEAPGADDNNTSTDTITVRCPDVSVLKTAAKGTIDAGETASFTIVVANAGPGTAYGVTLSDPLPAGVAWTEDSASCSISGQSLTCAFGDLPAGSSRTVTVSGTTDPADCGVLTNTATVSSTNESSAALANNTSTARITVQCPDLVITKVADAGTVSAGQPIGFTVTVTNNGPGAALSTTLNDPLPAGDGIDWSIAGQAGGASCTVTGAVGSEVLACGPVTLGDDASFSVHITSPTTPLGVACTSAVLSNTATADASNDDPVQATDRVTVQCPNLVVTKVADDSAVSAGEPIGFTVTVTNNGPGTALGTTLNDPLPASAAFGVNWTVSGQTGGASCTVTGAVGSEVLACGPVTLGDDASFSVHVSSDTVGPDGTCTSATLPNTATADASNHAPITASAATAIQCPGLNIAKQADAGTVSAGEPIGFTITVSNTGPGTAKGVMLDDPLPAGEDFEIDWSLAPAVEECSISGNLGDETLTCDLGDLAAGDSFSVHLTSPTPLVGEACATATLPNTATADGSNTGPVTASDSVTVQCPDLGLTKVAGAPVVDAGDDLSFTITATNNGPGTALGLTITDPLPAGVAWAADSADCDIVAGTLSCGPLDLAAGESLVVTLTAVTDEADCATYENTATADADNDAPVTATATSRVRCPLGIDVDKTGDTLAHVGDTVTYEFTVTNVGGEDLVSALTEGDLRGDLVDPECDADSIVVVDDGDGDGVLAAGTWDSEQEAFVSGEVWTFTCTRLITVDDVVQIDGTDFALNVGSIAAQDEFARPTSDEDPHQVELIEPAIEVVKTVDDDTPAIGQTVTFTYVVTNTGNTTLFEVVVTDDILGEIGTISELGVGESSTLTKTMVVAADSAVRNVATATGADVLGKTVTDDDDATITLVLSEVPPKSPPQVLGVSLPRTGIDASALVLVSSGLLIIGGALVLAGDRRRRAQMGS